MAKKVEIIFEAKGFNEVAAGSAKVTASLAKTAVEAGKLDSKLLQTSRASNSASQSLINLGRVAEDAPFGFIGIANNINPLLESFQRLKAETGSTATSLKALGSSLLGAGGLGLAVSVVSSLLVVFGDKLFSGGKAVANINLELIEFSKVADDATASLKSFNKEQEFLLKLNSANIVERFGKNFNADLLNAKASFISVAEEIFKTEQAIKTLSQNSQRAFSSFLKNSEDGVSLFGDIIRNEAVALYEQFGGLLAIPESAIEELGKKDKARIKAAIDAQKALISAQEKLKDLENQRLIIAAQNRGLVIEQERSISRQAVKVKEIAETLKQIKFTNIAENLPFGDINIESIIKPFDQNAIDNALKKGLIDKIKASGISQKIQDAIGLENLNIEGLRKFFGSIEAATVEFSEVLKTLVTDLFSGFAEGIGEVLAGGLKIGDVFKNALAIVGQFLIQLGKAAIRESALIKAIKALNPVAGLAAGLAAIAFGSFLKNQRFATGTRNAPGGLSLVGERGPELINIPRGAQVVPAAQTANMLGGLQAIEVYGMVRGSDIYFSNKRFGGTLSRNT